MVEIAKIGRVASHAPGPKARRAETQRRHALAKQEWQPSSLPGWLNEETYTSRIQPFNRYCLELQTQSLCRRWAYQSRMPLRSVRADADRIHGTGWLWRNWLAV